MPDSPAESPPQQARRRRLQPEQRRAMILEAAARQFARRGYHGASMMDIAADAGIAASVIYDHFATKRDLHLELLNQHASAMVAVATIPPEARSAEDLVRHATDAFFRFVEDNPYAWRVLFRDPPADEQTAAVHAAIHRCGTAAIAGLIALAPALRLALPMPRERANEMLAHTIKSGNDGLAAWWYEHPEVPRAQIVEIAVSLSWHGLAHLADLRPN